MDDFQRILILEHSLKEVKSVAEEALGELDILLEENKQLKEENKMLRIKNKKLTERNLSLYKSISEGIEELVKLRDRKNV